MTFIDRPLFYLKKKTKKKNKQIFKNITTLMCRSGGT